jgi:hypothetical protein
MIWYTVLGGMFGQTGEDVTGHGGNCEMAVEALQIVSGVFWDMERVL